MPEPELDIGKIVNHTHVLDIEEIRQVVMERVVSELGEGVVDRVEPVHVAPASESRLLTKAARAWRDAEGEELEFTDDLGSTKLFWFGIRYTLAEDDDVGPGEDVPTSWPPEGEGLDEEDVDADVDPQVAEQLRRAAEEGDEDG